MEMRRTGWREVYVEDELVRGSAPDKVRGAFGQRSRWCKVLSLFFPCNNAVMMQAQRIALCLTVHCSARSDAAKQL